jgi:YD repeat-containing protein
MPTKHNIKSSAQLHERTATSLLLTTSRTTMNASKTLLCALLAGVLLLWGSETRASTITYTYDSAGRIVVADYGTGKSTSYAYDNAGNLLQSSQPTLGISVVSLVGNQLTLAWPISPGGFVLQSASAAGHGAVWNNVGATPTQSGNLNSVTLTLSGATTFYRLKK